jgi:hypothetical protein
MPEFDLLEEDGFKVDHELSLELAFQSLRHMIHHATAAALVVTFKIR